ncbi:MAG: phage holin family protein [Saprospiraceae bacterium]
MLHAEKISASAGETYEYARLYVEQKGDYYKLEAAKKMAQSTSQVATSLIVGFFGMLVVLFLSLSVGFFLGNLWGSYGLAFLLITGIYALAAALVYYFRTSLITNPIVKMIISNLLN